MPGCNNKPPRAGGQFDPAPGFPNRNPTHLSYPMDTQEIDNIETAVNQDYPPHDPDRTATLDGYDDDTTPDNGSRAEAAAAAVTINLDDESEIADLISNLLHLAHSLDMDPGGIMRSAIINFHAEAGPLDAPPPPNQP
jgi:hypothetical protein